jgi:hypothetical protein
MKYHAPYGAPGSNDPYINGNPATGTMGSIPPAASIEFPQREIVNLIAAAGLTPDDADLTQLARAIQSGHIIYGVDTGSATAYAVTLNPPLLAYGDGLAIWVLPANANSGPATFNVNGLGARNIVRRGGAALSPGDMPQGYKSLLTYNALHANFELYGTGFTPGGFLPVLTANTNLYVNGTTGDDALYDGTAAAVSGPHGPFKTLTRAMTETFKYGPSLYTMTVNVAAGTYNEAFQTPPLRGPMIVLKGAGAGNTFVTGATDTHTIFCGFGNTMSVQDICATATFGTYGPPSCYVAYNGGFIYSNNTASNSASGFVFWADSGGKIAVGNHTFNAGSTFQDAITATNCASIALYSGVGKTIATYSFGGSVVASTAFAAASGAGAIYASPAPYTNLFSNIGFFSGQRYNASFNGVIFTQGLGPNFFPGTVAGGVSNGGQYG